MKKKVIYEIYKNGFIKERFEGVFDENDILVNPVGDFITTDLPQPLLFYKPKWNSREWVEGATQEEIDELTKTQPSKPTDTEILGQQMTEREIEAMIQGQQLSDIELRLLTLEVK